MIDSFENAPELIRVEDLHKSFGGLNVLNGITETIHKGEVVSLIGPSGSGKSTFLRCLNRLEEPTSGHIWFDGVDIADKSVNIDKHRQKMGMVFQHFNIFPHMSVIDNITLAPVLLGKMSKDEAVVKAESLLARVGLADKCGEPVCSLSGGQEQRVAIARALMRKPASASPISATTSPPASLAARSSGLPSCVRWRWSRRSCSLTNRPAPSTRRWSARCSRSSSRWRRTT